MRDTTKIVMRMLIERLEWFFAQECSPERLAEWRCQVQSPELYRIAFSQAAERHLRGRLRAELELIAKLRLQQDAVETTILLQALDRVIQSDV